MGSKAAARRNSVPQPGTPLVLIAAAKAAQIASANHVSAVISAGGGTGTANAGTLLGAGGLSFTPKVSGKIKVSFSYAGAGTSGAAIGTFSLTANAAPIGPTMTSAAGGDAAHTMNGAIVMTLTVGPLGTPIIFNVAYTSAIGFTQDSAGELVIEEFAA